MLIGIAGKICSGKDFLSIILQEHGFVELNLDAFGHRALEQKQQEVLTVFPQVAGWESGPNTKKIVDRKKLGKLVFRNPRALHKLEAILHPIMKELVLRELNIIPDSTGCAVSGEHTKHMDKNPRDLILNAAILEKLGFLPLCDIILWIEAPFWLRTFRIRWRKGLSLWQFLCCNWAQRQLKAPDSAQMAVFPVQNSRLFRSAANLTGQLQKIPQLQQFFQQDPAQKPKLQPKLPPRQTLELHHNTQPKQNKKTNQEQMQ